MKFRAGMNAVAIKKMHDMEGNAILFELKPAYYGHTHVVSSAISNEAETRTDLFIADNQGVVLDWNPLPGSAPWAYDPYKPLSDAGYTIRRLS